MTMTDRDTSLQHLLSGLHGLFAGSRAEPRAAAAMDRIYRALLTPRGIGSTAPQQLDVCRHLPEALAHAQAHSQAAAQVVDAFEKLVPLLSWHKRSRSGPHASDTWWDGHANTTIVGPGGLEDGGDIMIGASLLAPDVRYPDHDHPPEEVYLIMSPGHFKHGYDDWVEPGIAGTFYNEPGIRHAMRSGSLPLFTFWFLWIGA